MCVCVCVCVNSTSGGGRSVATPAYQGRLALVSLPLGAAVNKIKSATLTLPSAQGRPLACLHPTFPRNCCSTDVRSRTKLQSSPLLRQIQIHRLIPPKRSDRRTPPSHCSHTEFADWSIHDKFATVCLRTSI